MKKINNNLIMVLAILTFVFGLFIALPVDARTVSVDSGVNFNPYTYPIQYVSNPTTYPTNNNYPTVIAGCEGRNTGYSTVSGQSCVGNYVNTNNNSNTNGNTNNNTNGSTTNKNNSTSTTTTTSSTTNNTVSKANTSNSTMSDESDINEGYGSLTANAFLGSNSFMPTGLFQWILLAIIIAIIIFLWRYVHAEEKYMSEPLKHA